MSNDGRKVWATNLSLSTILHRKVMTIFMLFSCHICKTTICSVPEILLPWQRDVTTSPYCSPQYHRKCMKNSVEKIHGDIRVQQLL